MFNQNYQGGSQSQSMLKGDGEDSAVDSLDSSQMDQDMSESEYNNVHQPPLSRIEESALESQSVSNFKQEISHQSSAQKPPNKSQTVGHISLPNFNR